jgi:hypothetical protein
MKSAYKIFIRKPEGRHHLGDLGTDERTVVKRMLKKEGFKM